MCEPIMRRLIGSPQAVTDSTGSNRNDPSWRTHPPAHLWVGTRLTSAGYAVPVDDTGQRGADDEPPLSNHCQRVSRRQLVDLVRRPGDHARSRWNHHAVGSGSRSERTLRPDRQGARPGTDPGRRRALRPARSRGRAPCLIARLAGLHSVRDQRKEIMMTPLPSTMNVPSATWRRGRHVLRAIGRTLVALVGLIVVLGLVGAIYEPAA